MNINLATKLAVVFILMGISSCGIRNEIPYTPTTIITEKTKTPSHALIFTPTYTFTPTSVNFHTHTPTQIGTATPNIFQGKPGIYLVYEQNDGFFIRDSSGTEFALGKFRQFATLEPFPNGHMITFKDQGFIYTQNIISKNINTTFMPDGPTDDLWSGGWSPDGKYLAYAIIDPAIINSTGIVPQEFPSIYVGDQSTGVSSRVTFGKTIETSPSWSPDNQWIAFLSDDANPKDRTTTDNSHYGATDIYIMSTRCLSNIETCKSSLFKQLTRVRANGNVYVFSWNPDSTKLGFVYINEQTKDKDIYTVDLNGTVTNLTNTPQQSEDEFSWSPDGKKLVFRREDRVKGTDLFIFNVADNTVRQITDSPNIAEWTPLWSSDGKTIAYIEVFYPDSTIYYSLNDGKLTRLKNSSGKDRNLLFWLVVFPNIEKGAVLMVSPSGGNLNVRSEPSTSSSTVTKLESGDRFTILERPEDTNGYIWWKIRTQDDFEGWVVQLYGWYLPNLPSNP